MFGTSSFRGDARPDGNRYNGRMMRLIAAAALCAAPAIALAAPPPDPFKLYGSEIDFTVYRSGSEIGQHKVTFANDGGALVVRSLFDIAVKFLGVTVYRYHYLSQETWRGGELAGLASSVNDNGTETTVDARQKDNALVVNGPEAKDELVPLPILPSTHWDSQVIDAAKVLNTINGKVDGVKLVELGPDTVTVAGAPHAATHYRYTGDITAETWYDAGGHWVKLRFPGSDGTLIDYVCQRCVGAP